MFEPDARAAVDEDVLSTLGRVSTATLTTRLLDLGLRQQFLVGVKPVADGAQRVVGEAFTMRFIPAREDLDTLASLRGEDNLQWQAFESVGPGQVLVVDSRGDMRAASAGDMLLLRAQRRGAAGFVTDGAVRDSEVVAGLGLPAYAQAATATSRLSCFHVADLQVPIGCAGVAVYPGDIVVGDRDGVVVVPRGLAGTVAQAGREQQDLEDYLHERVRGGESLWGVYPPDEQTLREYAAWRATGLNGSSVEGHTDGT